MTERIRSGRKIVTPVVAVLLGLVFLAELTTGALTDPIRLLIFGANSFSLVLRGELFRLATANLLHGSVPHLLFNVVALVNLGAFLEPLLGSGRFLSVLLVSALVGAAGSAFLGHHALALGASTGIAGLIGAYVVILRRWPNQIASPPTRWTWIVLALTFLWPVLFFDNIDHAAHLTGFLAGFVVMSLDARAVNLWELAPRARALFRVTAALLATLFVAAGWMTVRYAKDPERALWNAAFLSRDLSLPRTVRNSLAWHIATNPDASRSHLESALVGIRRVTESEPENPAFRDTHATVHYRLGHWEEAVRMELELLAADRNPFYVSQLACFEWALARARGPLFLGQPPEGLPRAEIGPGSSVLLNPGDPPLPPGTILHLVLAREEKPSALLEVTIGVSAASEAPLYTLPQNLSSPAPDQIAVALIDTRKTGGPEKTFWNLLPMDPEAARLP